MKHTEELYVRSLPRRALALAAVATACCLAGTAAFAASIPVADGEVVVASNGLCSLREAIHNANADAQVDNADCVAGSGPDVLELAADSTYVLPDEDEDNSGLPRFVTEIVVDGNGAEIERDMVVGCQIDGTQQAGEFRLISIESGGVVTLDRLTLQNGCADGSGGSDDGGAIRIRLGSLTLNEVLVANNSAEDKSGGLDTTGATVTIVDSRFVATTLRVAAGRSATGTARQ